MDVAGQSLTVRADFKTEDGVLKGTVDFPQQSANSLPLANVTYLVGKIHFEALSRAAHGDL